jgi:AcrR family transcriptional regulator
MVRPRSQPLTRDDVLVAAVRLADRDGLAAVTMRSVAAEVGVEAMSLYHHVRGKDALLDGMVDLVFGEIHRPEIDGDWRAELHKRSRSGRDVLLRHPWAIGLMNSRRAPGPATLVHHDAVIGCLRSGGFSIVLTAHAFALLDAHLYGFLTQEVSLAFQTGDDIGALAESMMADEPTDAFPHLRELMVEHVLAQPDYAFGDEFEYGLELILDGLAARLAD